MKSATLASPPPRIPEPEICPIAGGDWVANLPGHGCRIGRVRAVYWDDRDGKWLIDLTLFAPSGDKIGRSSPDMGGPRSFEPSLTYTGEFRRIASPDFPLTRKSYKVPAPPQKGRKGKWHTVRYDYDRSVIVKPERVKPRRRRKLSTYGRVRTIYIEKADTNFDKDREIGALRRAAQELRDMARLTGGANALALKDRAVKLEDEAAKLASG